MAQVSTTSLPSTLNTLFEDSTLKDRYNAVRLTSAEALSALQLPLAQAVFGHGKLSADDGDALTRVFSGEISYTNYVAKRARSVLEQQENQHDDGLTPSQRQSQLLHIGIAALFSFLQSNVTGPPLDFNPAEVVLSVILKEGNNATSLKAIRDKIIRDLSVDGEAAYQLTPNVELFAVAKALLVDVDVPALVEGKNGPGELVTRLEKMRVNFLHQKMLSEVTGSLQDAIYADLEDLGKRLLDDSSSTEDQGRFLIERANIHTHHGFDAKARADLERAAAVRGFEFALTGKLGKRTKFQDRDISQLVVLAKSADNTADSTASDKQPGPRTVDLNDDTLLETISFAKGDAQQPLEGKSGTVQDGSSLPAALALLDPGNQPLLDPVDSTILLALASAITNTAPENGLTREETLPYATRVLDGGSSNWQIYTQALLVRSRIEGYKSRTVERSVLQMQALVDQVIADTAAVGTAAGNSAEVPTTFLPRPEKSESASASERLEYVWLVDFSTRWDLEAELASRWVKLGGLRTALEIYERLQMWAEAALCYAATDREEKARVIVRRQLYEPTNKDTEDEENEKFQGPERSPLPANAPRLFCILGDIDTDPSMYERAWEVSNKRYARAQRSLARHYLTLKPPALEKAEEAYRKSLQINGLNHGAWFALGCVQLELEKWEDAIESFTRTVQLEEADAEAWSNLAAAILHAPPSKPISLTSEPVDTETEEPSAADTKPVDPYKQKREALAALHRAAQLKHTDHRIWDNVLTVASSIPPPATPFRDVVLAQRRLIELLGPKKGEKCIDLPILGMLVDFLVNNFEYEDLLIPANSPDNTTQEKILRSGSIPGQIISLLDDCVVPLITHSAPLWLLVARVEWFRNKQSMAFEAHEKAWRATITSCTQGAFQMGDEKRWNEVVQATERLVRDGYARFGPMEKEKEAGEKEDGDGDGESELVAKDWRFKARSAVRGIMGKGKEYWEDTEGWNRLKELQSELTGGA